MDSGIGGLWTLKKIREYAPNENYLFFMDKLHAPYGSKSEKNLFKLSKNNIEKIKKIFDIKMVVLACNTLSVTCFDKLQNYFFDLPFVKIEPDVNLTHFCGKPTLVLATKRTVKSSEKIRNIKKEKNIFVCGFKNLAKKIDNASGKFNILQPYLKKKLAKFKNKGIKNVVLGCTHFNYIKSQINKLLGAKVKFFENSNSVAIRVKKLLSASGRQSRKKSAGQVLNIYKI